MKEYTTISPPAQEGDITTPSAPRPLPSTVRPPPLPAWPAGYRDLPFYPFAWQPIPYTFDGQEITVLHPAGLSVAGAYLPVYQGVDFIGYLTRQGERWEAQPPACLTAEDLGAWATPDRRTHPTGKPRFGQLSLRQAVALLREWQWQVTDQATAALTLNGE